MDGEAAAPASSASQQPKQSLLAAAAKTRKTQPAETEQEKQLREEQQIMADLQRKQALRSAMENAQVGQFPVLTRPRPAALPQPPLYRPTECSTPVSGPLWIMLPE